MRGLEHARFDRQDAGADHVGRERAAGQRQGQHAGGEGAEHDADFGQAVEQEEQLDDEGDVAEDVDVHSSRTPGQL